MASTAFYVALLVILILVFVLLILNSISFAQARSGRSLPNWQSIGLLILNVIFLILMVVMIFWAVWAWWDDSETLTVKARRSEGGAKDRFVSFPAIGEPGSGVNRENLVSGRTVITRRNIGSQS